MVVRKSRHCQYYSFLFVQQIQSQTKDPVTKNFKGKHKPEFDQSLILETRTRSKRTKTPHEPQPLTTEESLPGSTPFSEPEETGNPEPEIGRINDSILHDVILPQIEETSYESDHVDSQATTISIPPPHSVDSQCSLSSQKSMKPRRLPGIDSVASSQKYCFVCHSATGRKRIPKEALCQVWTQKAIMVPPLNRCCGIHLDGKLFTDEAMDMIVPTKTGVFMSDEELATWILDCTSAKSGQRRYNFDDPNNVKSKEYMSLVGLTRTQFDIMLAELKGHLNNSVNRSVRNALAMFLMMIRHNLSQVF